MGSSTSDIEKDIFDIIKSDQEVMTISLSALGIKYSDIKPSSLCSFKQGGVGNCWFVSTLSSLIYNNYKLPEIYPASNGGYDINFYKNSTLVSVHVSDTFIFKKCTDSTAYDFGSEKVKNHVPAGIIPTSVEGIYAMILEKAYAVFKGSYSRLSGGFSAEAFTDMTNGFCTHFISKKDWVGRKNYWWNVIYNSLYKYNSCIFISFKTTIYNIIGYHAYFVMDMYEFCDRKYLKIHNPWACTEISVTAPFLQLSNKFKYSMGNILNDGTFLIEYGENMIMDSLHVIEVCSTNPFSYKHDVDCSTIIKFSSHHDIVRKMVIEPQIVERRNIVMLKPVNFKFIWLNFAMIRSIIAPSKNCSHKIRIKIYKIETNSTQLKNTVEKDPYQVVFFNKFTSKLKELDTASSISEYVFYFDGQIVNIFPDMPNSDHVYFIEYEIQDADKKNKCDKNHSFTARVFAAKV